MKKGYLFLVIAFTMMFSVVNAQTSIIPKAGITFANMKFKEELEYQQAAQGVVAGIGFEIKSSDNFSIQPELLFIQQGFEQFRDKNNFDKTIFNYFQVPVMLKASFGTDQIKGYVNLGPSLGYAFGGKETYSYKEHYFGNTYSGTGEREVKFQNGDDNRSTSYYNPDYYNQLDFALQMGGGIGVGLGPGSLLLDVRYGLGFTNFNKEISTRAFGVTFTQEAEGNSRTLQLSLGYAIPIK